jgi:phage baseplate assembly protein gpV
MQRQIFNSDHGLLGNFASRFGALLAMTGLLLLSACNGSGDAVTEHNLTEPGKDGVAPTLTSATIKMARDRDPKPNGTVTVGQEVRVDIVASEGLMTPLVTINGVAAEVQGSVNNWFALREMTDADTDGEVYFSIVYQDVSGELGQAVDTTTDGSAVLFCLEGCPDSGGGSLAGDWRLDGEGALGVGPTAGDTSWWSADADTVVTRACLFDDVFRFGGDATFKNIQGDETWLEPWQGSDPEACGAPVAPHDGSTTGSWVYDEAASTLTLSSKGSHLGLPKAVNGAELTDPAAAPDSIVYQVLTLDGDSMTVTVDVGNGWWTFRLARQPVSPLAGKWKLDGEGALGVGPGSGDVSWWSNSADDVVTRACLFDDIFEFGTDGSFQNIQGTQTWLEAWQGTDPEACGAPVAPHDGSNGAIFQYDEVAGTLKLTGRGAHLGLAKAVNGAELGDPAAAPESITYDVLTLDGDSLTVTVDVGNGYWTFRLVRVSNSPVVGKWKLAGEGALGVGPTSGDVSWWSNSADDVVTRACLFDDIFHFGADGSFQNYQGADTWLEAWQGTDPEACGAPVAPHDGSASAVFEYDDAAGTLTLQGTGAHLGLAKAVNGAELTDPAAAPASITYEVLTLDSDNMTVTIDVGNGFWTFQLERVTDTAALSGKWILDGEGALGVGPTSGDTSWWSNTADDIVTRACLFDDVFDFGSDGSFQNFQDAETWLEPWQGTDPDACGAPVAPHDGSARAVFEYDAAASKLTIHGKGAHLGLAKAVNGAELTDPALAPESLTYDVLTLDGDSMTVTIDVGTAWWTFNLTRASNSPLAGNWKLDGEGALGVGPTVGDVSWWSNNADDVVTRACLFDDIFHFGADGSFQNFQDAETWLEPWQGSDPEACGAPVGPHDGSSAGGFSWDEAAGTLTILGKGSHLGLAKVVNGAELADPGSAPDSITYDVLTLDPDIITVTVDVTNGWWTFRLAKE